MIISRTVSDISMNAHAPGWGVMYLAHQGDTVTAKTRVNSKIESHEKRQSRAHQGRPPYIFTHISQVLSLSTIAVEQTFSSPTMLLEVTSSIVYDVTRPPTHSLS